MIASLLIDAVELGIGGAGVMGVLQALRHGEPFRGSAARLITRRPAVSLPTEIIPGVTMPSHTLAGMVAAHLIQHADETTGTIGPLSADEITRGNRPERNFVYKDGKMEIRLSLQFKDTASVGYKWVPTGDVSLTATFGGRSYSFDESERKIIVAAARQASKIADDMRTATKSAERQHKAVDIIEQIFAVKPAPESEPPTEPVAAPAPTLASLPKAHHAGGVCHCPDCDPDFLAAPKRAKSPSRSKAVEIESPLLQPEN